MALLSELAEIFTGIRIDAAQQDPQGHYLIVRPKNIQNNTIASLDNDKFVNDLRNERFLRSVLREGDIVVNLRGSPFRVGIYTQSSPPAIAAETIVSIRPNGDNGVRIIKYFLSEDGKREIESRMHGQVISSINLKDLGSLEVPVLE